jgi:DNA invertase Pin-like site-specific DNA recombinase
MKAAIYARVSDDKLKADGDRRQDVQRQVERLAPYMKMWKQLNPGWDISSPFIDDGKSAFKEDYAARPAFISLMNEIRAHRVNRVYVESLDRWSRRVVEGLTTLKEADASGCTIVSVAEGEIDFTNPQGWFRSLMSLGMAEWASREKSWKVTSAMERRRNDKKKECSSCGIVHMGRHPASCQCKNCRRRNHV